MSVESNFNQPAATPEPVKPESSKTNKKTLIIVAVVILGLLVAGSVFTRYRAYRVTREAEKQLKQFNEQAKQFTEQAQEMTNKFIEDARKAQEKAAKSTAEEISE